MRNKMRTDGVIPAMEAAIKATSRDDVKVAAQAVIDGLAVSTKTIVTMKPKRLVSAKELFAAEDKKATELSREMRNFLLAGCIIKKHASSGNAKLRHLYVTPDLRAIVCKDPNEKKHKADQEQEVYKIKTVDRGRCTPKLQRKRFGAFLAQKEECCFAVVCRERTFDMEADTETQREMWVNSLNTLILWLKSKKREETRFQRDT